MKPGIKQVKVKIQFLNPRGGIPAYQSPEAAGFDLPAALEEEISIKPGERVLIPTGIAVSMPDGYQLEVRPRSGLAFKAGITVLNSPGTVDPDYRGEIGVVLINLGREPFRVQPGDRIAQGVIVPFVRAEFQKVKKLPRSARGKGGYGHTGR
ncbi:MAG: dUTP diphosphatase [Proteobacteria bacterium]|nr:dUTP diphosphatase [Pseudomonadota bacterium]